MAFFLFRFVFFTVAFLSWQSHVGVEGNPVILVVFGGRSPDPSSQISNELVVGNADFYNLNGENGQFDISTLKSQNLGLSDTAFTYDSGSKTMFIVGGVHEDTDASQTDFFEYDVADNTNTVWKTVPHPPNFNILGNALVSMYDRYLVSLGGVTGPTPSSWTALNDMHIYDMCKYTWTSGNGLPASAFGGKAIVLDNMIFHIGSKIYSNGNYVYRLKDLFNGAWEQMTDANNNPVTMTQARYHHQVVLIGRTVIAIGGLEPQDNGIVSGDNPTTFAEATSVETAVIDQNGNGV